MDAKPETITETKLSIPLVARGKVRDTYSLDEENLLMVATDRLSAFDVVFREGIPHKGAVLNNLSIFWFLQTSDIIKNHFVTDAVPAFLPKYLEKRSMIVTKAKPLPLECVVRGYLTGGGLKEYEKTGKVCGIELPKGLKNGSELPHPIFTPSTKAQTGHDVNVSEEEARRIISNEAIFDTIKQKSIELYNFGKNFALRRGLVLADTKFEFGTVNTENSHQKVILIDEALTPDSSRYWIKEKYDHGVLESLDKQFVRDYLEKTKWNKSPPAPALPHDVIEHTSARYLQVYKMLTGQDLYDAVPPIVSL